jgi:hypothetical protein
MGPGRGWAGSRMGPTSHGMTMSLGAFLAPAGFAAHVWSQAVPDGWGLAVKGRLQAGRLPWRSGGACASRCGADGADLRRRFQPAVAMRSSRPVFGPRRSIRRGPPRNRPGGGRPDRRAPASGERRAPGRRLRGSSRCGRRGVLYRETARIDLNAALPELLAALFQAAGASGPRRASMPTALSIGAIRTMPALPSGAGRRIACAGLPPPGNRNSCIRRTDQVLSRRPASERRSPAP